MDIILSEISPFH